jgi:hypothetical protein
MTPAPRISLVSTAQPDKKKACAEKTSSEFLKTNHCVRCVSPHAESGDSSDVSRVCSVFAGPETDLVVTSGCCQSSGVKI